MQILQRNVLSTKAATVSRSQVSQQPRTLVRANPARQQENNHNPLLAVTLSALVAVNLTAAPLISPPPALSADAESIKSKREAREEKMRQARLKAEQGAPEAIPCVTIGCSADSDEAAAQRKQQAEARKEEVRRQAQQVYEQQRERKEKNFADVEAKSSFTGEQESVLKERIKLAQEQGTPLPSRADTTGPESQGFQLKARAGSGIFGGGDE